VQAAVVFTRVIKCQEVDEQIHLHQIVCAKLAQSFKELIMLGWIDIGQILQLTWKWEPDLFEIWFV